MHCQIEVPLYLQKVEEWGDGIVVCRQIEVALLPTFSLWCNVVSTVLQ